MMRSVERGQRKGKKLIISACRTQAMKNFKRRKGREAESVMRRKKRQALNKELDVIDRDRAEGRI